MTKWFTFQCSSTSQSHAYCSHQKVPRQPGHPLTSPPAQQEWQLCRLPLFNGTLPHIYCSWGMHHLLWSYWFWSTCHLTRPPPWEGAWGSGGVKRGNKRGHHSQSMVVSWLSFTLQKISPNKTKRDNRKPPYVKVICTLSEGSRKRQ